MPTEIRILSFFIDNSKENWIMDIEKSLTRDYGFVESIDDNEKVNTRA